MLARAQDTVKIEVVLAVDAEAGIGWLAECTRHVEAPVTIGMDPGTRWAAVVVPAKRDTRRPGTKGT